MAISAPSDPSLPGTSDPMLPRPHRVIHASKETHDTVTLHLLPCDRRPLPHHAPGQFNMLYAFGVGEVPISVSGDPDRRDVLVHTLRAVGAVTQALCKMKRGDVVGVRGPYGTAWPVDRARGDDIVMVAGGIGLAPLRPAFLHILARRRAYGRVSLVYGARSPADILYREELERWRGQFGLAVEVTVDRVASPALPGAAAGSWYGPVGVVTNLLARIPHEAPETTALVCGPEVMMRFAVRALASRGVPLESIFLSMERNMKCAIGQCGHCQFGPAFVCKDGPVFPYPAIARWLAIAEI